MQGAMFDKNPFLLIYGLVIVKERKFQGSGTDIFCTMIDVPEAALFSGSRAKRQAGNLGAGFSRTPCII